MRTMRPAVTIIGAIMLQYGRWRCSIQTIRTQRAMNGTKVLMSCHVALPRWGRSYFDSFLNHSERVTFFLTDSPTEFKPATIQCSCGYSFPARRSAAHWRCGGHGECSATVLAHSESLQDAKIAVRKAYGRRRTGRPIQLIGLSV